MNKGMVYVSLFCVLILVTMNNTLPLMAASYIVGELGGSNDIAFYVIAFYGLGNVIGIPIGRALIGSLKPGPQLFLYLCFFALFSYLLSNALTYPFFLTIRFLQGIVAGLLIPIVVYILFKSSSKRKVDQMSSFMVTIYTMAPALSASYGGWIAYDYHWPLIFLINIPFILFLGVFLWKKLGQFEIRAIPTPFDVVGFVFYTLSVLCLGMSLILGQQLDWQRSSLIVSLEGIGVFSLGFFILWEWEHPYPILNFRYLKNFAFSFSLLCLGLLFFCYFGMIVLFAFWLNLWVSYTPLWIGIIVGTMSLGGLLPPFIFSKRFSRIDTRIPLLIAVFFLCISSFYVTYFNEEVNFGRIAFSRVLAGFGLAFFLAPLFRLCFNTFAAEDRPSANIYFQVIRVLGSTLGVAFYITLWQRRQAFYHERLGSLLTPFSMQTKTYFAKAKEIGLQGDAALSQLGNLLDRQAVVLALNDCFYFIGFLMLGLLFLLFLTWVFRSKGFNVST